MDTAEQLKRYAERTEEGIARLLPPADTPPGRIHEAMRYSMQAGGKRLRPALVLAASEECAGKALEDRRAKAALAAAVAIECAHTYSLVHDDLPCMDDDDLRRGRPTAHKAFDEATALLAGDALLTHAFLLLSQVDPADPALARSLVAELGEAAGSRRLIGGQMADLLAEGQAKIDPEALEFIHLNKTAAMIEASLVMGGLCGGGDTAAIGTLRRAGRHLGMAFQIVDDILDATADTAALGKTAGKDARDGKATFVALFGLEEAGRHAERHTRGAVEAFRGLPGGAPFLAGLAGWMGKRKN